MSSKTIELRPDRNLLDPSFDGYKLSLQNVEILQHHLDTTPDRILPDVNNYSLLQARLFGLHNHLVGDSLYDVNSVYFVDASLKVQKTYKDTFEHKLIDCLEVWQIPNKQEDRKGNYNVSLRFISESLAAITDGAGTLYILDTGIRSNDDPWNIIFVGEVIGSGKKFVLSDVVYQNESNPVKLHVLLTSLVQDENDKWCTLLHWVTLSKVDNKWGQVALRELKSVGNIHYSYLERSCEAIYVVSDNGCKFILDSENPIIEQPANNVEKIVKYTWTQNKEDITINYKLTEDYNKNNLSVTTSANSIKIAYNNEPLLSGNLYGVIDADVTTWTFEKNILQIVMSKEEVGLMWPELVLGDPHGEYILDTCIIEEAKETLARLTSGDEALPQTGTTFNSQEVEECDFEEDKSSIFERLSSTTHEVSHKASLGCHQILITAQLNQDLPPAIGIRNDVDVCFWQPEGSGDDFTIKHQGTLNAFGYIQASKQQRKFSVCPPDLSYAAICESTRHLFIYRQNKAISSSVLRNRTSGQRVRSIAEQQVINIPNDEVIGIYSSTSTIFLLTEKSVLAVML